MPIFNAYVFQWMGFIGAASVLIAYGGVSFGDLKPQSGAYQGLNLLGAALIGASCLYFSAYGSVALNVVWGIIALYKLITR